MGNSASALPFAIGEPLFESEDGWLVHNGTNKANGAPVTVFKANKPSLAKASFRSSKGPLSKMPPAHHHFTYCKKVRHPQILSVLASLDTDNPNGDPSLDKVTTTTGDFIIVTEACVPLQQWLDSSPRPTSDELAWGLQCMVQALSFYHTSANLAHGNVHPSSWYVTPGGDVKLWNFSLATPIGVADGGGGPTMHFRDYEGVLTPQAYRSPERVQQSWNGIATNGVHCIDSFSLGILIQEYYKGSIPGPLQKATQRLQTPSLRMRPRLAPLLRCPVFDTKYATFQSTLEELTIQPVEQKLMFWQTLSMETVHPKVCQHKLLPLIVNSITTICSSESMLTQDLYRREVLAMMAPLFYIAEKVLPAEQVGTSLSPLCALLYAVKDRGVRGALLAKTPLLANHMNKNDLNTAVFEPLCSGFSDSSEALRELTLKACLVLVPHLYPANLEKLSRYLVRLQSDASASIRTHTLSVIPELAPHLSEMAREKLLLPAFTRAFKDPHPPARLAALKATSQTKSYFTLMDMAQKVLPVVMPLTLDEMAAVRTESFSVIDEFMNALRRNHSEKLVGGDDLVEGASVTAVPAMPTTSSASSSTSASMRMMSGGGGGNTTTSSMVTPAAAPAAVAPAPASSSSSYLGSMTSWMSSSSSTPAVSTPAPAPAAPTMTTTTNGYSTNNTNNGYSAPAPAALSSLPEPAFSSLSIGGGMTNGSTTAGGDGGWDDDDDDDDLDFDQSNSKEEDDPFASLGMKTTTSLSSRGVRTAGKLSTSGKRKSSSGSLSSGKLIMSKSKAAKPEVKKLSFHDDSGGSGGGGWDDF